MFISASLDATIRVWCLDKFQELYCFTIVENTLHMEISDPLTHILLISDRIFATFHNTDVKIGKLNHIALSFYNSESSIL